MSERKFKAGDRVRIIGSGLREADYLVGTVTTITGPSTMTPGEWRLDLRHKGLWVSAAEKRLAHVYDGDAPAKWADLASIWTPKGVNA